MYGINLGYVSISKLDVWVENLLKIILVNNGGLKFINGGGGGYKNFFLFLLEVVDWI